MHRDTPKELVTNSSLRESNAVSSRSGESASNQMQCVKLLFFSDSSVSKHSRGDRHQLLKVWLVITRILLVASNSLVNTDGQGNCY